jgi:hypothetical protein
VLVKISSDAAAVIAAEGGRLWVWAARPRMCCAGTPAWMHAATTAPEGVTGFDAVPTSGAPEGVTGFDGAPATGAPEGLQVFFRAVGGLRPDVLEVAMAGKRRPKVAAYWDGCMMAMA